MIMLVRFSTLLKVVCISFNMSFLETCKSYRFCLGALNIRKKPFLEFETNDLKVFCNETIKKTVENLIEALFIGIYERLFAIEETFWTELRYLCIWGGKLNE